MNFNIGGEISKAEKFEVSLYMLVGWFLCFVSGYFGGDMASALNAEYLSKTVSAQIFVRQQEFIGSSTSSQLYQINNNDNFSINQITSYISCEIDFELTGYINIDGDNLLAVVDKKHKLPLDYEPADLVLLSSPRFPVSNRIYLRQEAAQNLERMIEAIQQQGLSIIISSGWRSAGHQQNVYQYWEAQVGVAEANRYAALPGYSEHQLGTTVDLLTVENNYRTTPNFKQTKVGIWLNEHAHEYGFVMSYPEGKEAVTGYSFEPWHFRYIGVHNASIIKAQQTTLLEYQYLTYQRCL